VVRDQVLARGRIEHNEDDEGGRALVQELQINHCMKRHRTAMGLL
jgi:hypothetical protein